MKNVYIVAGGPGDPELITLKAKRLIDSADYIFTSKRFIAEEMLEDVKEGCQILNHFEYSYEDKLGLARKVYDQDKLLIFLSMGDPSVFGANRGLVDRLEKNNIDFEIVPGVGAFNAASARLKRCYTGLGITNTAICTSYKDVDQPREYLEQIASLGASVSLFMSVNKIDEISEIFMKYYPADTAVVLLSKITWEEERIVRGNLTNIAGRVKKAGVEDGLIVIGDFIDAEYDYELEEKFIERKKRDGWHTR